MIRDAQKNGLTIDDIAKMFSKTLNAVQQEDQKKKAITDARAELIEHMKDQFETAVSKGHLDCTDAAALYTLTMAEKYPDWTAENIKSKNKRGLIPSLFLYMNRGSQGSDLGDRELRKGYLGPIGTPLSYFPIFLFLATLLF